MNERKVYIPIYKSAQAAGSDQVLTRVDESFLLEAVAFDGAVAGAPSAASVDIKDEDTVMAGATALSNLTNGIRTLAAPKTIAAGSIITFDQN